MLSKNKKNKRNLAKLLRKQNQLEQYEKKPHKFMIFTSVYGMQCAEYLSNIAKHYGV